MPTLLTGSAGVHVQAIQFVVKYDLKDMRMATDKEPGFIFKDKIFYARRIPAGIATNMPHENIH
jgi:hypothetical protein